MLKSKAKISDLTMVDFRITYTLHISGVRNARRT